MTLNDYQSSFVKAKFWIHLDSVPQISEYLFPVWKSQINSLLPLQSQIEKCIPMQCNATPVYKERDEKAQPKNPHPQSFKPIYSNP